MDGQPKIGAGLRIILTDVREVDVDGVLFYEVEADEGTTIAGSWRDVYREWSGGASARTALPRTVVAGTPVQQPSSSYGITAAPGTNTTQLATTAFVASAIAAVGVAPHHTTHEPGGSDQFSALTVSGNLVAGQDVNAVRHVTAGDQVIATTGVTSKSGYLYLGQGDVNLFPALKRNATGLEARLAADTGYTSFAASTMNATVGFRVAGAAAAGAFLRGDGTNFVGSTLTLPNTFSANRLVVATAANQIGETAVLKWGASPTRLGIGSGATLAGPILEVIEAVSASLLNVYVRNTSAGAGTGCALQLGNSTNQSIGILQAHPNTGTSTPWSDDGFGFQAGLGNLHLSATASGKEIRFHVAAFPVTFTMDGASNFYPNADGVGKCGAFGVKWKEIWATNGAIFTSDARDKHAIDDDDLGLAFIRALRPVRFAPNDAPTERRYGLLAQDVLDALAGRPFDGLVVEDNGHYGLSYTALIGPLVKAIQDLAIRVDHLEG